MGCAFCATARLGLQRNLSRGRDRRASWSPRGALLAPGERLTNVVFMGMGEPLHNYDAVGRGDRDPHRRLGPRPLQPAHHRLHRRPAAAARAPGARDRRQHRRLAHRDHRRAAQPPHAGQPPLSARRVDGHLPLPAHRPAPPHHLRVRAAGRRERRAGRRRPARQAAARHPRQGQPHPLQPVSRPPASRRRRRRWCASSSSACSPPASTPRVRATRGRDIQAACGQLAATHQGTLPH